MATQGKKSSPRQKQSNNPFPKLPFHSPSFTATEKTELVERLHKGDIRVEHLNDVLSSSDWLKIRYDYDNGVWLVVHTFTPFDGDAPIGLVTYRAKRLENAIGMAVWKADELSESDFVSPEDDDF